MHFSRSLLFLAGSAFLVSNASPAVDTAQLQYYTCRTNDITLISLESGSARIVENSASAAELDPALSLFSVSAFVEPTLRFCVESIYGVIKDHKDALVLFPSIASYFLSHNVTIGTLFDNVHEPPVGDPGPLPGGSTPVALAPYPAITHVFSRVSGANTLIPSMTSAVGPYLTAAVTLVSALPNVEPVYSKISQMLLETQTSQLLVMPTAAYGSSPSKLPTLIGCTDKNGTLGHY